MNRVNKRTRKELALASRSLKGEEARHGKGGPPPRNCKRVPALKGIKKEVARTTNRRRPFRSAKAEGNHFKEQ